MRLYHLFVRNIKRPGLTMLTKYPMTHAECMVNKSKFSPATQSRIELLEVSK